jgi:prepilin signal peptidase PulO-like enzyme (type II secretory pathway)
MSLTELSILVYIAVFILGIILGSYLNSWIWRVHEGKYKFGGRSICIHCSRELKWYENIPLLSFLFLKGKCATCKKSIPPDYLFVEFATGCLLLFVSVFYLSKDFISLRFIRDIFFVSVLLITFVYDAKYKLVLPGLTWLAGILGGVLNYFYFGYSLSSLLLGFAVGGGFFLFQYVVSKGKWIGGGDVRLGAMIGLWVGWPNILAVLLFSYVIGALVSIPLLLFTKKEMKSEVPLGTFLAIGTFLVIFWGDVAIRFIWGY